jgi:hypothetical protein
MYEGKPCRVRSEESCNTIATTAYEAVVFAGLLRMNRVLSMHIVDNHDVCAQVTILHLISKQAGSDVAIITTGVHLAVRHAPPVRRAVAA